MKKAVLYLCLIFGALIFMYPFIWMLSASLAPENELSKLTFLPSILTINSYEKVIEKIPIFRALFNSLFVSLSVTLGVLVFGSMVGYALSRLQFRGRNLIFYVIIFMS